MIRKFCVVILSVVSGLLGVAAAGAMLYTLPQKEVWLLGGIGGSCLIVASAIDDVGRGKLAWMSAIIFFFLAYFNWN